MKFKLFLNTSFNDLDLRVHRLGVLADHFSTVIRPIPIKAPFGDSMLVVAPHQDDEAIGCGGALALQVRAGKKACVVVLHDGGGEEEESGFTREALTNIRNEESRRCAAVIGIEAPQFLGHADLAAKAETVLEQLRSLLVDRRVDVVFVPFLLDGHPDHRIANYILAAALRSIEWDVRILGYEVWGMCIPNVILAIDDVIEPKRRMLSCFEYANGTVDYLHSTIGLNMYHSRKLGAGLCRYAECFFEIPKEEYIDLVARVRHGDTVKLSI
jgi:LmbE family N-acetylglucosaminyl deacetylase